MSKFRNFNKLRISLALLLFGSGILSVAAETMQSTNYVIKDATIGATGEMTSSAYSLIGSFSPVEDARTSSGNYYLKAGFPNGIIANVPQLVCFETSPSGSSCSNMLTGCGYPGCYDRAKLEIDTQSNPIDTLYLVKIVDVDTATTYYLQSDHTLGATYDISDFMDICDIEGYDSSNPDCDGSGAPRWNESLQRYNVFGLLPNTEYQASVSALNGDFTGTDFGPTTSTTTYAPTLALDLDIATSSNPTGETSSPYSIGFGELTSSSVSTASNLIWIDLNTNIIEGINLYVEDENAGLYAFAPNHTISSQSEDLAVDTDGGYGIKTYNYAPSQADLGPLLRSATYNTSGADEVGALGTGTSLLFYTNTTGSNFGSIKDGRGALYLKARSTTATPTGNYLDKITFTLVANI